MKTRTLTTIFLSVATLTSCIHEYQVTDHSFAFSGEIIYDAESDEHRLTLTCTKKSDAREYNIAFNVDGENITTLTDINGTTHKENISESFEESDTHTYILSEMPVGMHILKLTITTENFSQILELSYEVTKQKYEIHSEVSTVGAECSTLLMSLADGDIKYIYTVSVKHGEEEIATIEIDFATTPIHTVKLPETLRPGSQSLTLYVSDGMTSKQYDIDFQEPIRHPEIPVTLSHDKTTGYHVAIIGYNPYGIRIDFSILLELKGKSSFYHEEEDFWWGRPEYKYITEKDERALSETGSDCSVNLTDRDGIAKKITSQWETSYIWASHSTPGGGEDSGESFSYLSGSQPAFYKICNETLRIDITGEEVSGITLKITNEIGKMTLNGEESTSGTTSITL